MPEKQLEQVQQQDPRTVLENAGWPGTFTLQSGAQGVIFSAADGMEVKIVLKRHLETLQHEGKSQDSRVTLRWEGTQESTYVLNAETPRSNSKVTILTISGST